MTEIGFIQALPMGALGDNRTSMGETTAISWTDHTFNGKKIHLPVLDGEQHAAFPLAGEG